MATMTQRPRAHQEAEDNVHREIDTEYARGGVVSGRVVSVLVISTVLLGVIYAIIWLVGVYG